MTDTRSQDIQLLPRHDSLGFDDSPPDDLHTATASDARSSKSGSVGSVGRSTFTASLPLRDIPSCRSEERTAEAMVADSIAGAARETDGNMLAFPGLSSPDPPGAPLTGAQGQTTYSNGAVQRDFGNDAGYQSHSVTSLPKRGRNVAHHPCQSISSVGSQPIDYHNLIEEHDSKWTLNVNVQFRDRSEREKFFVTYAERPNSWRRLTIVWDYRNMHERCLERDLQSMVLQRDRSIRLFQSLRDSLQEIRYFDTVTRLTLRTEEDGQLHIYVSEDLRERIVYPSIRLVAHIDCPRYSEHEIDLVAHLSGYVYRVNAGGRDFVRKDLGGQHGMEGFLYELNALSALKHCVGVINLKGVVTDNSGEGVIGFLVSCGSRGALSDVMHDVRDSGELDWPRRRKWARQVLHGLAEIHEAGYVQGDFTLGNIVIDNEDNANIVDFDRSGCPVGWEPPELMETINSRQRVRLMIGVKSDLFQLGMCLYALAAKDPEPDRAFRRGHDLRLLTGADVPDWYKDIVRVCLSPRPQDRVAAMDLLRRFDHSLSLELGGQARGPSIAAMSSVPFSSFGPRSDDERSGSPSKGRQTESQALSADSARSLRRDNVQALSDGVADFDKPDDPPEAIEGHATGVEHRVFMPNASQLSRTSGSRISYVHGDHLLQDWSFDTVGPVLVPLSHEQMHDPLFDDALIQFADDADRYIIR